jgi:hypothetical protein
MKASIGVRTRRWSSSLSLGISARTIGWSDHQSASATALSFRMRPSGHLAPATIQARIASTWSAFSGGFPLGISGLSPVM